MADLSGLPIPKMDWENSNLPETWRKFQSTVELMFKGPLSAKEEEIHVTYLLLWVGEKGREIADTWTDMSADDKKQLAPHYERFKNHVQPKLNPIFARYKFNLSTQGNDSIEQYVTRLRTLAKDCSFTNKDEMIRDRIVFGVTQEKAREKLINVGADLTLDRAIQIVQTYEYSQLQLKTMKGEVDEIHAKSRDRGRSAHPVHSEHRRRTTHRTPFHKQRPQPQKTYVPKTEHAPPKPKAKPNKSALKVPECDKCGYSHRSTEHCPAKGEQCAKCKKYNHFAKLCKSVYALNVNDDVNDEMYDYDDVYAYECDDDVESESDSFVIDSISNVSEITCTNDQAFCVLKVETLTEPKSVRFKIDTGSQVNIMPKRIFDVLKLDENHNVQITPSNARLTSYSGESLDSLGCCNLKCSYSEKSMFVRFHIIDTCSSAILGLKDCLAFKLIKLVYQCDTQSPPTPSRSREAPKEKVEIKTPKQILSKGTLDKDKVLSEYSDIFEGIGKFPGECNIQIDPAIPPVVHPPRKVPLALHDRLAQELTRMETEGIITKVTEPTQWVNSLVVVETSSGKLRVCLDPRDLNKAIQRPHYPMRTLEDTLPELSGAKIFTKLDLRCGYWTIPLSKDSSYLTTFNTPFGRYRYLRLPFGLKSSQDEFQRKVDECFEGIPGVVALVDDILVFGKNQADHDLALRKVLDKARQTGLKFNSDKLYVAVDKVKYFGHILTSTGIEPDPDKVAAILHMPPPTNKAELQTMLGMMTYLSKFAPNLSSLTSPMRKLLAKDTVFVWDEPQQHALEKVKIVLTSSPGPILRYFDPSQPIVLQVDASKHGLGAALLQEGKPIAYASKSLTPSECDYAQIEKELFAIVFGCKRFHQYIYGRKVTVQSDHKPLVPIFKKPLHAAPPRLQRMLLQLGNYDLDITYVPGTKIPLADTLSRKHLPNTFPKYSKGMDSHVHSILSHMPISNRKLDEIRTATANDLDLQTLIKVILNGWPSERRSYDPSLIEFWNHRDELTYLDGLVLKGHKILIPRSLRKMMLEHLHIGHAGIERTLRRARTTLFLPGLSNDVCNLVSSCPECLTYKNSNPKEPLTPHSVPDYPWQTVATDLFHWDDKEYLVIVDYYSRYFEVCHLNSTTSKSVIKQMKSVFSRFGIPEKVVSDNGPQYSSSDFTKLSSDYGFMHTTSSPRYPQSNGLAERTVQTIKRIFQKAKDSKSDPYLGLLEYRNTPIDNSGYSPAELLQGRQLRSILPILPSQLTPKVMDHSRARSIMQANKDRTTKVYNRSSHILPPLKEGEIARLQQDSRIWKPCQIISRLNDKSYAIKTPNGTTFRRNRRHLTKSNEEFHSNLHSAPNIFDNAHSSPVPPPPSQEQTLPQPTPVEQPTINDDTASSPPIVKPYVTRSGRVCKPKKIVDM
ncbi:hypothetical protein FSP39_004902 [Pinctada imbricata]|uniref:RNA-directed DNA polymerase n=1 Tax=Pinctada imbricata TaxID=66713 RepID=A0AA89C9L9_PINIB|nr:hypothetical protein FSP39_004902 [Pinctada imbricata]